MACIPLFQRQFFLCSILSALGAPALGAALPAAAPLALSASAAYALHTFLAAAVPLALIAPLTLLLATAAGYLAFRYFALKNALQKADQDLREILEDLSQNRIVRLPLPDRDLEKFTGSVNATLEEIRRERLSYEEREARFQELIENISHGLRTPLTVILGYLKWMKKAEQGSRDQSLEIIERNARSMEKLVSQFYAFSRLHAQDYVLDLQTLDTCRLLRESITDHYQLLEGARLNVSIRLPEHPVLIRGSGEALERIFSNLLQNAVKYALTRLDICLKEPEDGTVRILFQNDTESLRQDDIPLLFNRFYKHDNSRHQGGSGLGLTVAKSLAELMGGTLTAELFLKNTDENDPAGKPSGTAARYNPPMMPGMPDGENPEIPSVLCFTLVFPNDEDTRKAKKFYLEKAPENGTMETPKTITDL